jgi:hypothetical protein
VKGPAADFFRGEMDFLSRFVSCGKAAKNTMSPEPMFPCNIPVGVL